MGGLLVYRMCLLNAAPCLLCICESCHRVEYVLKYGLQPACSGVKYIAGNSHWNDYALCIMHCICT